MVMAITLFHLAKSEKVPSVVETKGIDVINIAVELTIDPKIRGMKGDACAIDVVGASIFKNNRAMRAGTTGRPTIENTQDETRVGLVGRINRLFLFPGVFDVRSN